MGRALLSRLSEDERRALFPLDAAAPGRLDGFARPQQLFDCLDQVAQQRHAVIVDGSMPGIGAIAAAVRNPADGELRGLCLSFVSHLPSPPAERETWRQLVLREVGALGQRIGDPFWRSWAPTS